MAKHFKRMLLVLVVALLVAGLVWTLSPRAPLATPVVAIDFLGFTNASGKRVEALFAISNPPNAAVALHSVVLKEARGSSATNSPKGTFSWGCREAWGLAYAVQVDTTNEPLRIVLEFQQQATGLRRMVDRAKELFSKLMGNEVTLFSGTRFLVTNETRIPAYSWPQKR